ncbi:MAG TPA: efflux RND transporter permease subunit [Planctomycetota bacterium]|nr:efflux RND transporter permease subunit [Planctomycetota bacterium]
MLVGSFVNNPVKVAVGVLLVALFGTIGLLSMPMQLTPEVQTPQITVETRWPGASPQEVEREIVQEQEEQLKAVEGVTKMTGECMDSMGRITLEFAVGTDMAEALLKVNTRLQQVREYPEEADEPVLASASSADTPIAWFILRPRMRPKAELEAFAREHPQFAGALAPVLKARSTGLAMRRLEAAVKAHPELAELQPPPVDVEKMRRFAEDVIEARFERVEGIANANVLGGREDELQVIVDPNRLAARGVTIGDLRIALRTRNADTSGGDFWEGKRRYVVRTLGQFTSPKDVADLVVARRDGAPVYVRDVAEVQLGYKKPDGTVRNFGVNCLAINAQRDTGANVLDAMKGLQKARDELDSSVLAQKGLTLEQVYDETEYIYSAVGLVKDNIVLGGALTIAVLLVFLRSARSTLVIALAIPTSIIGTFLLLHAMGRSLNVVSLAGLAFAVGMLVDNAIVVLENIFRRYQEGERRFDATVNGTQEVWGAVIASTLTTLAVFVPIVFVQEQAGQLFRDIALAISCSVGLSLVVSAVVIPPATARILPKHTSDEAKKVPWLDRVLAPLSWIGASQVKLIADINRWLQASILRSVVVVVALIAASVLGTKALFPKVEYLPSGNRNLVIGFLIPPAGYNNDELVRIGETVSDGLKPFWDVDPDSPEAKKLPFPAIRDFFFVARGRQVFTGLRSYDDLRAAELVPLLQGVISKVPGTFGRAVQTSLFERGITAGRTVDVEITGPSIERLVQLGYGVMGGVMKIMPPIGDRPGAVAIPQPSLDLSSPEVHVVPKWSQAADLEMSAADLGYAVDSLVDGAYATDYFEGGDKIDLTIVGDERFSGRMQDLEDLPIATPAGRLVPLRALADIELSSGPEQINHRERQRAITIQVTPPPQMALEDAMDRIQGSIVDPLVKQGALGDDYRIALAGTADKLRATWLALRENLVLALFITYLLMAALFESWLYPFVVILSVPLGAVGGFLGLALLNLFVPQPLDVLTMLGFVILIGTVVNNPILIVHQSILHLREGQPPAEAIPEAVRLRIRPIFMTTMTTLFGLLPLVLFPGAGSELYRGLGAVLLGGLLVSTVFTLFLIPTFFRLALEAKAALGSFFQRS